MHKKEAWDLIDRKAGKIRVMEKKCDTCIFHPGNRMNLGSGRLKQVVDGNLERGALLTCHKTLPYSEGDDDPAACNGFWTIYGLQTAAGRVAKFVIGIIWVKLSNGGGDGEDPL